MQCAASFLALAPHWCRWRGVGRAYLRAVSRSGGLEGKFAQDVYPYVYALRDWGRGGNRGLRRLALDADSDLATAENAAKLWDEWKDFWNASAAVLVEKTPENVVRSTFLQALYPANARFVFVLRHPLAWALAVDKCAELGFSFKPRTRHLVVGALAGAGFAYQTTGIGSGLPFFIRWPLLPFRASEAVLSSLAYGIRAADARAA